MCKKILKLCFCFLFLLNIILLSEVNTFAQEPIPQLYTSGLIIEAEDAIFDSTWSKVSRADASGGAVLTSDSGGLVMNGGVEAIPNPAPLRIKVNALKAGNYSVYFRLLNPSGKSSYYLRFNGIGKYRYSNISSDSFDRTADYTWFLLSSFRFNEGENIIEFCYRHEFAIDKFIISPNAVDMPQGLGLTIEEFKFKENISDTSDLYPVPTITPGNQRPRLLLNQENIPTVRANLNHERNVDVYNKLLSNASKNYDCILNISNMTDNTNINYLDYIEANAFLYAIFDNTDAGQKAINGILNYLRTFNVEVGSNGASRNGPYMVYIASLVYDWCNDLLTTSEKEEIVNLCILHLGKSEMRWPPIALNAAQGHGEESALGYMLAFGIAVYGDYSEAYNIAAGKVFSESIPSRNIRYDDNYFNHQGETYGMYRSGCDWFIRLMLYNLGCDNLMDEDQRWNPYQWIYRNTPVGHFLRDGDNTSYPLVSSQGSNINAFLGANMFNDPYLNNEFYRLYNSGDYKKAKPAVNDTMFLIYNNVDLPLKQREELPLSWYSGSSSGMMTARTGWDEGIDSNTMVVSMKTPERYFGGHQQRDAGHFYIYYKGPLALDSGVYTGQPFYDEQNNLVTNIGSDSVHNANYAKQTIAHNAILVYDPNENTGGLENNGGQYPAVPSHLDMNDLYTQSKYGEVLGYDYGEDLNKPSYTYLKGDLTGYYGSKVSDYIRSFMFFNFFDEVYPGALIVFDRVTSANPSFNKYWLLHSQEEPQIQGNKTTIKNTQFGYNGRLINETLLPKSNDLLIDKIGGEGLEYPNLFGVNQKAVPQNEYGDESGKWRIEVKPQTEKATDYFLNVMQVSENNDSIAPLESEYYESGDFVGVKIKDRVAYFSKNRNRTSDNVTITAAGDANETLTYAVADLEEGKWDIYKNGSIIATKDSALEGGVVSFSGAPGTYTLVKNSSTAVISKNFNIMDNVEPIAENKIYAMYNNIFDSKMDVVNDNGNLYIPLEYFFGKLDRFAEVSRQGSDITVDIFKNTNYARKLKYILNSVSEQLDYYGMGKPITSKTLSNPIKEFDGKLYYPVSAIEYQKLLTDSDYDDAGGVLRINGSFNRNNYMKTISVKTIGNGQVSPNGNVSVMTGTSQTFIITPDPGYAIEYVKFNDIVVISGSAVSESYITPLITSDSEIEVKFYNLDSEMTVLTSPLNFKERVSDTDTNVYTFTFGRVSGNLVDISDLGIIAGNKKYPLDSQAFEKAILSGWFGIGLCDINNYLPQNYIVIPYATKNGVDIMGASTVKNKDMEETIVTTEK